MRATLETARGEAEAPTLYRVAEDQSRQNGRDPEGESEIIHAGMLSPASRRCKALEI